MKKIYFLLLALCFFATANGQIVNIPDANFKAKLLAANTTNIIAKNLAGNYFKIDANSDGEIQQIEAQQIKYLYLYDSSIADLSGIKAFTNLQTLSCSKNKLTSLDVSALTNLQTLDCFNNQLTSLNVSSLTKLVNLACSNNRLTSLNVSGLINLAELSCPDNQLISLNVSGCTNLKTLYCNYNRLASLDVSNCTNLQILGSSFNQLTSLNVSGCTNLKTLSCNDNQLTSLAVSICSNLQILICSKNLLGTLDVSGLINLSELSCDTNQLTTLKVSGCTNLETLYCRYNRLTSLDCSGLTNLGKLYCENNQLISLVVLGCTNLKTLYCDSNQLKRVEVSNCTNLQDLTCDKNQLTSLDVSGLIYLGGLSCNVNQLTSIGVSGCTNLKVLLCDSNRLTSLDVSGLTNLRKLYCENNQLKSLDILSLINLGDFNCSYNQLMSLDASNLKKLIYLYCIQNQLNSIYIKNTNLYLFFGNNPQLKYICADEKQFSRLQLAIDKSGLSETCHINSYCSFNPGGNYNAIKGQALFDIDKNGCNANDETYRFLKFKLNDGTNSGATYTNHKGNYVFYSGAGNFTLTPELENPSYFAVSPAAVSINFLDTNNNIAAHNFCIAANGVHPDLEITLLPLRPAVPGFDAQYKIVYKNKGNQTQSGAVNLTFNDAVLDLVVAANVTTTSTVNNLSWNFTNLKPFETREITFTMNVNSPMEIPAVNNGDILNFTTTITSSATDETPADNAFTFNQTVVGSYDPNDKTCLEGAVITPALIGQYVHYLIRFENTGTFAAENVVIKDMIDLSKFDISTLVPTSASHSFVTKISDGNKVEFIFEKINLPFDDANNDGYIAFKIKTKPTLVVNDSFTNEANIYFDYNFPILTNKATSTFKTLGTQDFDFGRYFTLYPNPAKADLNITAKETINVKSISIYNTLGQLVLVVTNADKVSKIDVSSLKAGNYFVQIKTDKGSSNARFIKE